MNWSCYMQVSLLPLVPPIVIFLAKNPLVARYDLSSLEFVTSGAAPLSAEVEQQFLSRLNVEQIKQCTYYITYVKFTVDFKSFYSTF